MLYGFCNQLVLGYHDSAHFGLHLYTYQYILYCFKYNILLVLPIKKKYFAGVFFIFFVFENILTLDLLEVGWQ